MGLDLIEIARCRKEMAVTAQAMLAGNCPFIEGAQTICGLFDCAQIDKFDEPFVTFLSISSETDVVPFGWLRENWHPSTRSENEIEWNEAENWAAKYGKAACREVISWVGLHPF
jgi:hypothetical protein